MFSRFAHYFDEVARRGSIRKAAEVLNIAPSAIDRQILRAEQVIGAPLFERLPQGLRPTAVGELLLYALRGWLRDYELFRARVDEMKGLRRGEIVIALVEGAMEFLSNELVDFHKSYPGITYRLRIAGSRSVIDMVHTGDVDIGLTFNPPDVHSLRVERALVFQLGAIMAPDHPLAAQNDIRMQDLLAHTLVLPDETLSLRALFDKVWSSNVGEPHPNAVTANSINMIKSLVRRNIGVGILTRLDALSEINAGALVFKPLLDKQIPLSVLSLLTASGRSISPPASLLLKSFARAMVNFDVGES